MTLPLAIIGAGSIGQRHIEVATRSDRIWLTAVVEPDATTRARLQQAGLPMVAQASDIPAETRAVVIATPTLDHLASGQLALDRGWGVLVEKPTAGCLRDGRALVEKARALNLPFVTGHHRRCHPFSLAARTYLAELGDPVAVQGLWSVRKHDAYYDVPWRCQPGAGPLMTNLSHEIDLLRFLMGDVTEITATLSNTRRGLGIEDTAALSLRMDSGALGSFVMSDAGASPWSFEGGTGENPAIAPSGEDYLRIIGTQGSLAFPSLTRWGRGAPGEIEWSKPLARHDGPRFDPIDPLLAQIERFAKVMDGAQDDVLCMGDAGVKALEMTLAAVLSGQTRTPVQAGTVPEDFAGVLPAHTTDKHKGQDHG